MSTLDERFAFLHTGRELGLMLAGRKPLAMFSAERAELPDERLIPESAFAPAVASGSIVRAVFELPGPYSEQLGRDTVLVTVLFAIAAEQWRIPAMQLLRTQHRRTGCWNETLERIEGRLLGYSDAENDRWCRARWQCDAARDD